MGKALEEYLAFWKEAYLRDDPWEAVLELDGPWPKGLREALGDYSQLPPEPFYGFLNDLDEESRKRDVLMLFINPGHVERPSDLAPRWLRFHRRRYLEWKREDYLQECGVQDQPGEIIQQEPCKCPIGDLYEELGKGCQWRRQRFGQARNNVGWGELRFLHTMEYSFYHSDKWSDLAPYHRWIRERPTTRLAMAALREIAEEKLVSRIVTIGKDWRDVLSSEPDVKQSRQMTYLTERGGYSHRMYQYAVGSDALPIVTYISGAGGIQFPAEERAVRMLDWLTEKLWENQEMGEETFAETSETSETAEQSAFMGGGPDPCDVAKQYLMDIQKRLDLPDGEYTKTAPTKGKDKFRYMHIARKSRRRRTIGGKLLAKFDLAIRARAVQILTNQTKVTGVKVMTPEKKAYELKENNVIVSANAFQTPRLLLSSGIKGRAIGHYLTLHSYLFSTFQVNQPLSDAGNSLQGISFLIPQTESEPNQIQIYISERYQIRDRMAEYGVETYSFGKVESRYENRVYLDPDRRDPYGFPEIQAQFSFSEKDKSVIAQMAERLKKAAAALGSSKHIEICMQPPGRDYHVMGTCRMGDDPTTSSTNRHGQIHGISGLFVADNSILPTTGAANPTLTTAALAIRTADYIARHLD